MKKSMKFLAVAGALALAPSMASAYHGILAECLPTAGTAAIVELGPGLQCAEVVNKLKLSVGPKTGNAFDNCGEDASAPWDFWAAAKYGSKITAAAAALIDTAELSVKGGAMGSCNLSGSTNGAGAYMTGKFVFYDTIGEKVKGGAGKLIARVGADLPSQSAALNGIVNKGFGVGSVVRALAGLDIGSPINSNLLACNLGLACPPDVTPIEQIALLTNSSSTLRVGFPDNADCTAADQPWDCCTGAGTGDC
jgi:hypothetical protein